MHDTPEPDSPQDDSPLPSLRRPVACPKHPDGCRWGCDRGFAVPTRADCFDCGYNVGWETCSIEISSVDDEEG